MKVVRSDDHRKHFPKGELYGGEFVRPFECPERWEHIMDRLGERGFKDMLDPHALDMSPVRQIHDEGFLEFLETAWDEWQVKPRFVALVGKGRFDFKNVLDDHANLLPPPLVSTNYGLFAADMQLGDVSGEDGLPEIAIGRLPAARW